MRLAQWLAVSVYGALLVVTWVRAGVTAAMLILACVLVLLAAFRLNDAGEAVTDFARRLLHRRPTGPASS